jgi:hypothetical protein
VGHPRAGGLLVPGRRRLSEPVVLGEKILSLLEESSTVTTYKPALLLLVADALAVAGSR